MKYKDLIVSFEGTLSKVCMQEQITFPVTLGLNAFRVFLNEFMNTKRKQEKAKAKLKVKTFDRFELESMRFFVFF